MEFKRSGTQPCAKGPEEYSRARCGSILRSKRPTLHACVARVSRLSRAHAPHGIGHPLGQTLIIASGFGCVQSEGQEKVQVRPGDVIWCPPKEQHRYGAALTTAMRHIAIQEALDGKVDWSAKNKQNFNSVRTNHIKNSQLHSVTAHTLPCWSTRPNC